jgi:hypothetical protein
LRTYCNPLESLLTPSSSCGCGSLVRPAPLPPSGSCTATAFRVLHRSPLQGPASAPASICSIFCWQSKSSMALLEERSASCLTSSGTPKSSTRLMPFDSPTASAVVHPLFHPGCDSGALEACRVETGLVGKHGDAPGIHLLLALHLRAGHEHHFGCCVRDWCNPVLAAHRGAVRVLFLRKQATVEKPRVALEAPEGLHTTPWRSALILICSRICSLVFSCFSFHVFRWLLTVSRCDGSQRLNSNGFVITSEALSLQMFSSECGMSSFSVSMCISRLCSPFCFWGGGAPAPCGASPLSGFGVTMV